MLPLDELPPVDKYGHYYFGMLKALPAVFLIQSPKNPDRGKYFVCPSGQHSVPKGADGRIKAFDTPEEALGALRRAERGKKGV